MIFYPINEIEFSAEDAQLFNCTRSTGIYSGDDFRCEASGVDNSITINEGIGWMRLNKFRGGVFAIRDMVEVVDLGIAPDTLPRIDVVGVQFLSLTNEIKPFVKQGTPASEPLIPAPVQNENTYELYFCAVKRPAGAATITADMITDLRLNNDYCGLMADSITKVDTVAINNQITALIKKLDDEIKAVHDGSAWLLKSEVDNYIIYQGKAETFIKVIGGKKTYKWDVTAYKDGKLEMYTTVKYQSTACNEAWGSALYSTPTLGEYPYPTKSNEGVPAEYEFIEPPADFITIKKAQADFMIAMGYGGTHSTATKSSGYALVRTSPLEKLGETEIAIHTIGRWR